MKKWCIVLLLMIAGVNAFSQVRIGIGSRGFGMGMRVPMGRQGARQQGQNIENEVRQMKNDLKLDSAQVISVRNLLVERDRRRRTSNQMTGKEFDQRMHGILDAEQYDRFAQKRQERQQQRAQNKKEDNPKKPEHSGDWDDVYN